MQITFDPNDPADVTYVRNILAGPESERQQPAPAPPVPATAPGILPTTPAAPVAPAPPQAAPAPPRAAPAPPPVTDDPMPNPANLRTAGEVSDGQLTPESFRQRIAAVGQRVGMPKLRAFIESKGFNKLDQIPAANFIDLVTGAEAIA